MQTTILPKKTSTELPIAVNDDAHAQLVADPTIHQFVQQPAAAPLIMVNSYAQQPINQASPAPVLTAAAPTNAASGADFVENTNTDWINNKWRPLMGWMYMAVCMTHFVVFPVLWSLLQALSKGAIASQWQPLTLQGAGLFHIAMGAVLGVAAYGRTKEKLENKA
jgi:hypothetical protein